MKKTILINAKNKIFGKLINFITKIININNKIKLIKYKYKIIIMNLKYIKYTGLKLKNKIYYRHSNYPGGLKKIKLKDYIKKNNKKKILKSIKGVLKKNKLSNLLIKKIMFFNKKSEKFNKIKPKIINNDLMI